MKYFTITVLGLLLAFGCSHTTSDQTKASTGKTHDPTHHHHVDDNPSNQHMNKRPFAELVAGLESEDRAQWQKPDLVLEQLGDLTGKTVLDIGAGTGYFSFPLAERGAQVIAADVDDRFLEYISDKKRKRGVDNLTTRKVPYDSPGLSPQEVDAAIIINTYHHINERIAYFAQVKQGLKPGGQLLVVDYKKEDTPHGPPMNHRMSAETVERELKEAGFQQIRIDPTTLTYQYMVLAQK
mgnify:CR=1 FL=1